MAMPSTTSRRRGLRLSAALAAVAAAGVLLAGNVHSAAAVPPDVISRWDNEIFHDNTPSKDVDFVMNAGHYTMTAKLYAQNTGSTAITYQCSLHTGPGGDGDVTQATLAPHSEQAIFLNVVHTYPDNLGRLHFGCNKPLGTAPVVMRQVKITTVKVNTLSNSSFNG